VHESDEKHGGCDFGEVIANCPAAIKSVRGFNSQKVREVQLFAVGPWRSMA